MGNVSKTDCCFEPAVDGLIGNGKNADEKRSEAAVVMKTIFISLSGEHKKSASDVA